MTFKWNGEISYNKNLMRLFHEVFYHGKNVYLINSDEFSAYVVERVSSEILLHVSSVFDEAKEIVEYSDDKQEGYSNALKHLGIISGKKKPEINDFEILYFYLVLIGKIEHSVEELNIVLPHTTGLSFNFPVEKRIAIDFLTQYYGSPTFQSMYDRLRNVIRKLKKGDDETLSLAFTPFSYIDFDKLLPGNWPSAKK